MEDVKVSRSVTIPARELKLRFSPSGGPGGQHANKASTRVELTWDVSGSEALGPRQRERVLKTLARRIDSAGTLRLTSDAYRSQLRNRQDVLERLRDLVADALRPVRRRVGTTPTTSSREKRLRDKRRRSELKRSRRVGLDD